MSEAPSALIADFLQWLAEAPRSYAEAVEAWATSCPRLTVWEDALDEGLVRRRLDGADTRIELTELGRSWLRAAAHAD
jgi:hypothetical protein